MANLNRIDAQTEWRFEPVNKRTTLILPNNESWSGGGETRVLGNGLKIGRFDMSHSDCPPETDEYCECSFGLRFISNARYSLHQKSSHNNISVNPQQLWRLEKVADEFHTTFHDGAFQALAIDFADPTLERWNEDFTLPNFLCVGTSGIENVRSVSFQRFSFFIENIISHQGETLADELALESQILHLLGMLIQAKKEPQKSAIDDVIDILKSEYTQRIDICELAKRVGTNECYLKRDFKQVTNTTIARFVRELRMQEAMRMIADENKHLKETALFVGYKNPEYFSKAFTKHFGVSPHKIK